MATSLAARGLSECSPWTRQPSLLTNCAPRQLPAARVLTHGPHSHRGKPSTARTKGPGPVGRALHLRAGDLPNRAKPEPAGPCTPLRDRARSRAAGRRGSTRRGRPPLRRPRHLPDGLRRRAATRAGGSAQPVPPVPTSARLSDRAAGDSAARAQAQRAPRAQLM